MNYVFVAMISLLIGIFIGYKFGYILGKRDKKSEDFSNQLSTINNLSIQIAELKAKYEEIEKSRLEAVKQKEKLDEEREKRLNEFIQNTHKLFSELTQKTIMIDEQKDKRISELVEQMKNFLEEQRKNTEQFLIEQGKSREEIEKRRDAQIEDMKRMISIFTKAVSGTKTRGITGEILLKDAIKESIKVGLIKANLKTENGEVEFAWDLGDGKYIPIDSKLPDIFEILEKYNEEEDINLREKLKKEIINKVKKEIQRIQKYQNLVNTIDSCILVVPESILDLAPELIETGKENKVYICSYKDVFVVAHTLQDRYVKLKEEGDIGKYKQIIETLIQLLEQISKKTDTIERALTTIRNANEDIRKGVAKGKNTVSEAK
ncbi:recombinase RmuC [Thermosipho sp. 1063]|uniref:DNA recombination protein RmuC n=1 Tax=unclassified Thermosipho (in: thermotogales) TaxID=2676525 RepID=UPI000949481D|nr:MULTISPECIES: DNA recombination protein RmuC [unclassified Thermosipho (in: thermotogales)]ANQ52945.1 DNA recombination protein RmuC [Thermosipho sp. 1070]APT71392.1 recombinase RmuC [Thermosipho sp. 1063]OOC46048.1 recombinase RmuC [Thermosipho sp. 1074]